MQLARVGVRVLVLVDVVCVMLVVLIARVGKYTVFVASFSVVGDVLFAGSISVQDLSLIGILFMDAQARVRLRCFA